MRGWGEKDAAEICKTAVMGLAASKKIIVLSGVPGTGKTQIAEIIAKGKGWKIIAANTIAKKYRLFSEFDKGDGALVVRLPELAEKIRGEIKKCKGSCVVEGHLCCEFGLPASSVIVLRTNPGELEARMGARGYSSEKIRKNVLAEMLDYCVLACEKNYPKGKIFEYDTTGKKAAESAKGINAMIGKGHAEKKRFDWSAMLFEREVDFRNLKL